MPDLTYEEAVARKSVETLAKLLKHPKHATAIKRAIREVEPNANFPELDAEDQFVAPMRTELQGVRDQVASLGEKMEKFLQASTDRDAENALASDFSAVQKKYGFTEGGLRKVMERMRDKNNPDVEAAAAFVNESIPRARPAAATGTDHLPQNFDLKRMFAGDDADAKAQSVTKDPWAFFDAEVRDVLDNAA